MLSICIPIYNTDVNALIKALEEQCNGLSMKTEIVLIDDASKEEFKQKNKTAFSKHNHILLPENIGRARIRNLFLNYAQYEFLLFLDCDGIISSPDFLFRYQQCIEQENPDVACGGRIYPEKAPGKNQLLRWKYGVKTESKNALERSKNPNQSFMTNNFLIRKSLFETLKFDERLQQYGHEDTLFGIELMRHRIPVWHLENPVLNGDIESNELFIEKTEKGIENLLIITGFRSDHADLIQHVKLLSFYFSLRKSFLTGLIRVAFSLLKVPIKRRLIAGKVNLKLFDFYKLGYISSLNK
jgi:glycosyltransferase involved in cell wall biosynthesis